MDANTNTNIEPEIFEIVVDHGIKTGTLCLKINVDEYEELEMQIDEPQPSTSRGASLVNTETDNEVDIEFLNTESHNQALSFCNILEHEFINSTEV